MSINKMTKEELELLSYKDITNLLLEEEGATSTKDLFKRLTTLLQLPNSTFEDKIGDYYVILTTDKRFVLLEDGKWDLRSRHTSDKIVIPVDEEDELDDELEIKEDVEEESEDEENFDIDVTEDDEFDDSDDDLKDLVVIDEDELGLDE